MLNKKLLINSSKRQNKSLQLLSSTGQKIMLQVLPCSNKHVLFIIKTVKMYKQIPNYDKCLLTLEKLIECNNALNKGAEYYFYLTQYMGCSQKLLRNP